MSGNTVDAGAVIVHKARRGDSSADDVAAALGADAAFQTTLAQTLVTNHGAELNAALEEALVVEGSGTIRQYTNEFDMQPGTKT